MDLDAPNPFGDTQDDQDVYIDSVLEITNIVPDVGVKVEVNENACHSLPFLQDPATVTSHLSGYVNPLVPQTDFVRGSGSTEDPIRVEVQKDLFVRGTLGSTQKPIEVDNRHEYETDSREVIDIDENGVQGYVQTVNHNNLIAIEDGAEVYHETEETPAPVEIFPIEDEEPVVQISSVPFNQQASKEISTRPEKEKSTVQPISYITFSNENQLVIRPLARAQEQGSSYLLDDKELKNISKEINKPYNRKRKIAIENDDTTKVEKKKIVKKKVDKKKVDKKKAVPDFSKWGGRVSKAQLNEMIKNKERCENETKQKNIEKEVGIQRTTRSRGRTVSKPANLSEKNIENNNEELLDECVRLSLSTVTSKYAKTSYNVTEDGNSFDDNYSYNDDDDGDDYVPDINDDDDNLFDDNEIRDSIDSNTEKNVSHSDSHNEGKNKGKRVKISNNKNQMQENNVNSTSKANVKHEFDVEDYVLLEVIKVEDNSDSYNMPLAIGAISSAQDNEKNIIKRKRGRPKKSDTAVIQRQRKSGQTSHVKKNIRKVPQRSSARKVSQDKINAKKDKKSVTKIKQNNITKAKNNNNKLSKVKSDKKQIKSKSIKNGTSKVSNKGKKNTVETPYEQERNDKNKKRKSTLCKLKDKEEINDFSPENSYDENDTIMDESGNETDDYVPSADNEEDTEYKPKRRKVIKTTKDQIRRPANRKDWPCTQCNEIFPRKNDLRDHRLEEHAGDNRKHCEVCGETLFKGSSYSHHMEKFHGIVREYECLCQEKFKVWRRYKEHKKNCTIYHALSQHKVPSTFDHKEKERKYMCELCGMTFHLKGSMVNHERYFHAAPGLQCPFCPKKVKTKTSLLYHVYAHKEVKDINEENDDSPSEEMNNTEMETTIKENVSSPSEMIDKTDTNQSVAASISSPIIHTNQSADESFLSAIANTDQSLAESVLSPTANADQSLVESVLSPTANADQSLAESVLSPTANADQSLVESVLSPTANADQSLAESVLSPTANADQSLAERVLSPITNENQFVAESVLSPFSNTSLSLAGSVSSSNVILVPGEHVSSNITNPILSRTEPLVQNTPVNEIISPITNVTLYEPSFENKRNAFSSENKLSTENVISVSCDETNSSVKNEAMVPLEEDKDIFKCPLCDFCSSVDTLMKEHILVEHAMKSRKPPPPSNKVEDKDDPFAPFKPRSRYNPTKYKYVPRHYKNSEYLCSICGQAHASRTSLSDHIAATHTKVITRNCEVCGKGFMTYYAHMRHRRVVHGIFKDPHKKRENACFRICSVCGQSVSKGGYGKHLDMHNGVYRFQCEVCSKACRSKHDLMVHSRIHTGEKPYKCDICDRKFSDLANLRHHEKRVHKVNKASYTLPKQKEEIDDLKRELMQIRTRRTHIPMEYE